MEFHEKFLYLRKEKGLTQEELSEKLFVSRTAISKWESGRGLPNIESLKAISKLFDITIDELLSGEEIIRAADEEKIEHTIHQKMVVFGLLDTIGLLFIFIPMFGQKQDAYIDTVSLLNYTDIEWYMLIVYWIMLSGHLLLGIAELMLQNSRSPFWRNNSMKISFVMTTIAVLVFMLSRQPWPAFFMFWILLMKTYFTQKQQRHDT